MSSSLFLLDWAWTGLHIFKRTYFALLLLLLVMFTRTPWIPDWGVGWHLVETCMPTSFLIFEPAYNECYITLYFSADNNFNLWVCIRWLKNSIIYLTLTLAGWNTFTIFSLPATNHFTACGLSISKLRSWLLDLLSSNFRFSELMHVSLLSSSLTKIASV